MTHEKIEVNCFLLTFFTILELNSKIVKND